MEGLGEHEILVGTYEEFVLGYKIGDVGFRASMKALGPHAP